MEDTIKSIRSSFQPKANFRDRFNFQLSSIKTSGPGRVSVLILKGRSGWRTIISTTAMILISLIRTQAQNLLNINYIVQAPSLSVHMSDCNLEKCSLFPEISVVINNLKIPQTQNSIYSNSPFTAYHLFFPE